MTDIVEKLVKGTSEFVSMLENNIKALVGLFEGIAPEPKAVDRMTYEDAIKYFIQQRPEDDKVDKGVILRERNSKGYLFIQAFLDNENNVIKKKNGMPFGRKLAVKELDEELAERFSDKDMILVE